MAAGTPSEPEERASALVRDALKQRQDQLSGSARIPAEDRQLSERILGEARRRSAELSASQAATALSGRRPTPQPGIPWWLWLGWLVAVTGVVVAFKMLA